ncbi:hypothetical protein EDD18DRAFT_1312566 [Armillaria luteobubalina]|uniref:CxC2-like cysteine cluster KDZ transposase-associated domain-containing protein n=1 Tax=Armillaria luteobubalina TaxID=153913 RepID=A0AA39P770_9AGAR|nr:hypothetical protein EDD18DRAFT_1312566 [Armillaria luteobubalina]
MATLPPSDASKNCATCGLDLGRFLCLSCMDAWMLCKTCIVWQMLFLFPCLKHELQEWTGSYFTKITLGALGLLGDTCSLPTVVKSFVIIDVDGIFMVQMGFCDCMQATDHLRPATTIYPQTAATFHILHLFQVLSFMSKISIYEFYQTLACLADNTGMHPPPDRYGAFLQIIHEWQHLWSMKQFGRGHEPGGIEVTQPGELALHCPACPHPHINLPDGWANNIKNLWIYHLFLAIDANFHLHHLNVSSEESDPSLNHRYGYFVEEKKFRSHLETYSAVIPIEEKSTCNNHDAVKLANSRGSQGAAATGVGTVVCGCHDMKCPLSVGDLQKGERYINMDYFALSMLACSTPPWLVISYDIACQWHKNVFILKFHLPAHILPCHNNFSFNYSVKVGRTDGEAPEQDWAATNALANSTKEMGPGSCQDTLDNHFGDYNCAHTQHVVKFISFEDALCQEHSTVIDKWRKIVLLWESDHSQSIDSLPAFTNNQQLVRLTDDIKEFGTHLTDLQWMQVQQQANHVLHKIEAWIEVQKTSVIKDEHRLQLAQAHDTLVTLHEHLLLKSYLVIWWQQFSQALHIEWCKSHARVQCWQEECVLLMEEMH